MALVLRLKVQIVGPLTSVIEVGGSYSQACTITGICCYNLCRKSELDPTNSKQNIVKNQTLKYGSLKLYGTTISRRLDRKILTTYQQVHTDFISIKCVGKVRYIRQIQSKLSQEPDSPIWFIGVVWHHTLTQIG